MSKFNSLVVLLDAVVLVLLFVLLSVIIEFVFDLCFGRLSFPLLLLDLLVSMSDGGCSLHLFQSFRLCCWFSFGEMTCAGGDMKALRGQHLLPCWCFHRCLRLYLCWLLAFGPTMRLLMIFGIGNVIGC